MTDFISSRRDFLLTTAVLATTGVITTPLLADNPSGSSNAWHRLSERDKGLRIFSAALADNGRVAGQCKPWVQDVIRRVTGGHVKVPLNASEPTHTWQADRSGHIQDLGRSISQARTGDIVQMVTRFSSGEQTSHTAIVGTNSGGTITWLESNYRIKNTVTSDRSQTHRQFEDSLVGGKYTVYRVR